MNDLKLVDEFGNQVYPELPYIAKNGNYKYLTVSNALEKAKADDMVEVFADAAAEGALVVPVGVTLNLGAHGNAGTSYALTGAESNSGATLISTKEETVSAKGEGVDDDFFKVVKTEGSGTYTYTLQPNHEHMWGKFELNGNVLTTTCTNGANTCTVPGAQLAVTLEVSTVSKEYDGNGFTATLSDTTDFEAFLTDGGKHTVNVGEVTIEHPSYSTEKWYAGAYTAKCVITIDGTEYTLTQGVTITKPQNGYADGFEAMGIGGYDVRFDTFGEAVAVAEAGATIYYRSGNWNADSFTASASKDITLDLGGKTLTYSKSQAAASDLTIKNDGAGTVTLVHGTIQQPVGQQNKGSNWRPDWQNVYYDVTVSGPFAFGKDLTVAWSDTSKTVTANDSLAVVDGKYQSAFAGKTKISGGVFTVKPTLLADGYVVRTIGGDYPYEVIKHEHVMVTDIIGENTLSNYCAAGGCDLAVGQWATLSVNTPATYTGKAFAGVTKTGELDAELTYFDGETQLDGAPTAAGDDYKVVMSYNDKAITNGFEITAATIDSIAFDPAEADFTGSPITTKMTVKAGSLTLGIGDYDITAGSLTATGSAAATTNIEVTVVGRGNFQGTKTGSWTIKAPGTGDATFKTPTSGGDYGTLNGTTLTIDEKSVNLKETSAGSGVWTMSMTVGVPLSQSGTKYIFTPEALLFFTKDGSAPIDGTQTAMLAERGIVVKKGAEISAGTYDGQYKVESFTWTETITAEEAEAARKAGEDKIVRTIKAYAVSYSETASYIYTLTNEGGLPETTYTIEIPLATLKLIDEYGNQRYPVLTYVAKIGNVEYTSVSNALEAAEENKTVELTAADPVAGAYDLPVGVTLKIGGFGNAAATYKLCAKSVLIAAAALDAGKVTADTGLGIVGPTTSTEGVMYETEIVHVHGWTFAAEGNVLTATCTNDNCYLEKDYGCQLKITLDADGGEWTGNAFAAEVEDGFVVAETPEVKDYSVSEITYSACDRDGQWGAYTTTKPVQVGKYKAQVTVTVEGAEDSPFTLDTEEYEITRPTGGYSSGYELKETGGHYTTFSAAVADARDGDTIVWWETISGKKLTFASDKEITIDCHGGKLEAALIGDTGSITVSNTGSGRVTLCNLTIEQNGATHNVSVKGPITFGDGIACTTSVNGYEFENLKIISGKYSLLCNPTDYVPDRGDKYVVKTTSGSFPYSVIPHTHVFTGSANGGVLTVKCTGDDSDLCKYKDGAAITLSAANATATGEAYAGAAVDNQFAADEELAKRCPEAAALSVADVVYYTKDDPTPPLPSAPVECGEYVATLTYGEGMASVEFKIWHAEHSYTFTANDAEGTITAKCVAEGPCEEENKDYKATLTAEDKTYDGTACEATKAVDEGFPADVALEYWKGQTQLNAAPTNAGIYVAKMIATTNNATAAAVEKAFTISKATYDMSGVTFDDVEATYDGEGHSIKVTDGTLPTGVTVVSYENNCLTNAGTYTVTVKFAGDAENYKEIDDQQVTLTINPAQATVTAENAEKIVGEDDPKFTAKVEGLVGEDALVYTVTRTNTSEEVGTYDIVASGEATQGNYNVSYVNGTFTIKPKPVITIKIVQGDEITDVLTNGESIVDEEIELPAGTTQIELTLEADLLTVPLYKWVKNNVTNVMSKTATYDIADGDTLEFVAEEAANDPEASEKQIKDAIIEAIDPAEPGNPEDEERYQKAVDKVNAIVGDGEGQVSAKVLAGYIADNNISSVDMAQCDYVVASAKLNTDDLIDEETEVEIVEFAMAEGNAMTFEVEIDGWGVESAAIKDMVEASSDLSDWEKNKLEVEATFEPGGEGEAGKVTVTPKDAPDKAFLKIVIPKDPSAK